QGPLRGNAGRPLSRFVLTPTQRDRKVRPSTSNAHKGEIEYASSGTFSGGAVRRDIPDAASRLRAGGDRRSRQGHLRGDHARRPGGGVEPRTDREDPVGDD